MSIEIITMYDPYSDFTKHILPNGLTVYTAKWDRNWVKCNFVIHTGSYNSNVINSGTAHFVEHLVSANHPTLSTQEIEDHFRKQGGSAFLGGTSPLQTNYGFQARATKDSFEKGLITYGEMLLGLSLVKGIEKQRAIIQEEFSRDFKSQALFDYEGLPLRTLFPDHKLSRWNFTHGSREDITSLTQAEMQEFYDTHYVPQNMSIIVLGGLPDDEMMEIVSKSVFGQMMPGNRNPYIEMVMEIPHPLGEYMKISSSEALGQKTGTAEYNAYWSLPSDMSYHAYNLYRVISNKFLNGKIREEKDLTYGIRLGRYDFGDIAEASISGNFSPNSIDSVDSLVTNCLAEVKHSSELFEKERSSMIESAFMHDLSGSSLMSNIRSEIVREGRITPLEEDVAAYAALSFEDILEVSEWFSPDRNFVLLEVP